MLRITVDPNKERVEFTIGEHTIVLFVDRKVEVGIIAPKEFGVKRVKNEQEVKVK
tara:strand:- start:2821 stop:2985 length:165 start_codon:yes stop_codon:yes gene_type:complete